MVSLFVQKGGSGNQTYVLLHGLGCSSDVWRGLISVIEKNKAGKWIAPDMRGHGRSEWQDSYALGSSCNRSNTDYKDRKKYIYRGSFHGRTRSYGSCNWYF